MTDKAKSDTKQDRLAQALRENLRRRKTQTKERKVKDTDESAKKAWVCKISFTFYQGSGS